MIFSKYKSPQKGAAKKIAEIFRSTRKKRPSERLIQIISEVGEAETPKTNKSPKKDDRAAKDAEI